MAHSLCVSLNKFSFLNNYFIAVRTFTTFTCILDIRFSWMFYCMHYMYLFLCLYLQSCSTWIFICLIFFSLFNFAFFDIICHYIMCLFSFIIAFAKYLFICWPLSCMAQLAMKVNVLYVLLKVYTVETLFITLITQHLTKRSPCNFLWFLGGYHCGLIYIWHHIFMSSFDVHPGQFALVEINCLLLCPCYSVLEVFGWGQDFLKQRCCDPS